MSDIVQTMSDIVFATFDIIPTTVLSRKNTTDFQTFLGFSENPTWYYTKTIRQNTLLACSAL